MYDASGQRVRKVIETQNGALGEERLYLGGFEIYRKFGTGALVRETLHIMDDKQRIALVETKTHEAGAQISNPQSLIRYQLGNHLGSASLELDKDGGLISYEEYHPYGTTAFQAMNSAAEVSLKRYRYTGKERDEETGLYYHGARYYAPWLGRWISCDPKSIEFGSEDLRHERLGAAPAEVLPDRDKTLPARRSDSGKYRHPSGINLDLASSVTSQRDSGRMGEAHFPVAIHQKLGDVSTYTGLKMNPVRFVDPDGRDPKRSDSNKARTQKLVETVKKGLAIIGILIGTKTTGDVPVLKPVRQRPKGPDMVQVAEDEKRRRSQKKKGEGSPDPDDKSERSLAELNAAIQQKALELELARKQQEELARKLAELQIQQQLLERQAAELRKQAERDKTLAQISFGVAAVGVVALAVLLSGGTALGGAAGATGAITTAGGSGGGFLGLLPALVP